MTFPPSRLGFFAATALTLSACGWRSDGLARLDQQGPPPAAPAGAEVVNHGPIDLGTPQCRGLGGDWALMLVEPGTISPLGEPWKITVTDLFLAKSEAGAIAVELTFCDQVTRIVTSGGQTDLGRSKVPDALRAALASTKVVLPLPGDGTFQATDQVWLWGLRGLANPATDALPTKDDFATDPRLWDQDGDGNPGVTMNILAPAGDRYMVRRARWNFAQARLTLDNAWLTGTLTATIEENALGASTSVLLTSAPITPKAEGALYQLRCVGSTYTCPSLAQDYVELFKDAPR
jgi:hypothetical protein